MIDYEVQVLIKPIMMDKNEKPAWLKFNHMPISSDKN